MSRKLLHYYDSGVFSLIFNVTQLLIFAYMILKIFDFEDIITSADALFENADLKFVYVVFIIYSSASDTRFLNALC